MSHIGRALSRALTKSVWLTLACLTQSTPSTETATIFNNGGRDARSDNVQAYPWNVHKICRNLQHSTMGMRDARSDNVQRKMFKHIFEMFKNLPQSSILHTVTNNVQRKMYRHFFEKVHNVQQWWGEMFGMICIMWSPMHLFDRCIDFSEFTMFNKVQDPYEI